MSKTIPCHPSKVITFREKNSGTVVYTDPTMTRYWWLGRTVDIRHLRQLADGLGCSTKPSYIRSLMKGSTRIYHSLTR